MGKTSAKQRVTQLTEWLSTRSIKRDRRAKLNNNKRYNDAR